MKHFPIALICFLQIFSASADQRSIEDPISVTHSYKDGLSVRVSKNEEGKLSEVLVVYGKHSISVSPEHLKNIFNPILGTVYLVEYPSDDDAHRSISVSLEFENRPYEWGYDTSRVTYELVGGELIVKAMTIPVAKGDYIVSHEFEKQQAIDKNANKSEQATPRKPSD